MADDAARGVNDTVNVNDDAAYTADDARRAEIERLRRKNYKRNAFFFIFFCFTWGFGVPFVYATTTMPAFFMLLTGRESVVGVVQALIWLPVVFSVLPRLKPFARLSRKRFILAGYMLYGVGFLLFGAAAFVFGYDVRLALALLLPVYFLINIFNNLIVVFYQEYYVDLIPPERIGWIMGLTCFAESGAAGAGSLLSARLLGELDIRGYAVSFILAGVLFVLSSLCILISRDIPRLNAHKPHDTPAKYIYDALRPLLGDRNVLRLILFTFALHIIVIPYAFFIVYYQNVLNVTVSLGTINTLLFASQAVVLPFAGLLSDRFGKTGTVRAYYLTVILCYVLMILKIPQSWAVVFFTFGISGLFNMMITLGLVSDLPERYNRFDVLVLLNAARFIGGAAVSYAYGFTIERFAAYPAIFAVSAAFSAAACVMAAAKKPERAGE